MTVRDWNPSDPLDLAPTPACAAVIQADPGANYFADHATHVAGTMMGSGSGNPTFAGMSPNISNNISYVWPQSAAEVACEEA